MALPIDIKSLSKLIKDRKIVITKSKSKISEKKTETITIQPVDFDFKPSDNNALIRKRLNASHIDDLFLEVIKNTIEYGNNAEITIDNKKNTFKISNGFQPSYRLEDLNFRSIIDQLTTGKGATDKNLNEGLTTLLITKCKVRVKHYCFKVKYTNDGYFQRVDSMESSHFPREDGLNHDEGEGMNIYKNPYKTFENIKKWEVTIYLKETEDILMTELQRLYKLKDLLEPLTTFDELMNIQTEYRPFIQATNGFYMRANDSESDHLDIVRATVNDTIDRLEIFEDFHNYFIKRFWEVINLFKVPKGFEITINRERYFPKFPEWIDLHLKRINRELINNNKSNYDGHYWRDAVYGDNKNKGWVYAYVDFPPDDNSESQEFPLLWQLKRDGFYHIIENRDFYGKNILGIGVVTHNRQLSNVRRTILQYEARRFFENKINYFKDKHRAEVNLKRALETYIEKWSRMRQYIIDNNIVERGKYDLIVNAFKDPFTDEYRDSEGLERLNRQSQKEETLVSISNYIYTYGKIFKKFLEDDGSSILFNDHPSHTRGRQLLDPEEFRGYNEILQFSPIEKFPEYKIGNWIDWGHPSEALLKDIEGKTKSKLLIIDPSNYTQDEIQDLALEIDVLYPLMDVTENIYVLDYIIDLEEYYVDIDDIKEMINLPESIEHLDFMLPFAVNTKRIEEKELEEKEAERKRLEEEKERLKRQEEIAKEEKERLEREGNYEKAEEKLKEIEKVKKEQKKNERNKIKKEIEILITKKKNLESIQLEIENIKLKFNQLIEKAEKFYSNRLIDWTDKNHFISDIESRIKSIDWDIQYELEFEPLFRQIEETINLFNQLDIAEEFNKDSIYYEIEVAKEEIIDIESLINEKINNYKDIQNEFNKELNDFIKDDEDEGDEDEDEGDEDEDEGDEDEDEGDEDEDDLLKDISDMIIEKITDNDYEENYRNIKSTITSYLEQYNITDCGDIEIIIDFVSDYFNRQVYDTIDDQKWDKIKKQLTYVEPDISEIKKIKVDKKSYYIDIIEKDDVRVPVLFTSKDSWLIYKKSRKDPIGFRNIGKDANRFRAFAKAVDLACEIMEFKTLYYPIWFYDDDTYKTMDGKLFEEYNLIGINGYRLKNAFNQKYAGKSMSKINQVQHIIDIAITQLNFKIVKHINKKFLFLKEYYSEQARIRNIDLEIRKIL